MLLMKIYVCTRTFMAVLLILSADVDAIQWPVEIINSFEKIVCV